MVEPAAGETGVIGPPDVAGEGVPDDETVLRLCPGDAGQDIVEIGLFRLAAAHRLGDEKVLEAGGNGGGGEPGALDGLHGVGDDVEPPLFRQNPAHRQGVGEEDGAGGQHPKVGPVHLFRVAGLTGPGEVPAEPLHQQKFLGASPGVEVLPQLAVAPVVEGVPLLGEGKARLPADLLKGRPLGGGEVEEGVVRVKK